MSGVSGPYRDSVGTPLTAEALIGRRAQRWSDVMHAFGPPAVIEEVSDAGLLLKFDDGSLLLCQPREVTVPAVTEDMLERGALALFGSYRRQADPAKTAQQLSTARAHAEVVLRAAIER